MKAGTVMQPQLRRVTVGVFALVLIHALESMSAATIMPMVATDLGGIGQFAWVFSGYTGASLLGMTLAGRLCDRYGARAPYLASVGLFVLGLVLSGASTAFPLFVAGRVLQGFSAGIYIVTVYFIVLKAYPEALRPRVFGLMPIAWGVASLAGPQLAGFVGEAWSWRAVFLAVPWLVVVAGVIVWPTLPAKEKAPEDEETAAPPVPMRALLAITLSVFAIQFAGKRLTFGTAVVLLTAGVVLILHTRKVFAPAVLGLVPGGARLLAIRCLLSGCYVTASSFIPLMLMRERGLGAAVAGSALTAMALAWAAGGWYQGRFDGRSAHQKLLLGGSLIATLSVLGQISSMLPEVSPITSIALCGIGGLGMGLAVPSVSVLLFEEVPTRQHGTFASLLQVADSLGCVTSLALTGCLFATLHGSPGESGRALALIFLFTGVLGLGASALALRSGSSRVTAND